MRPAAIACAALLLTACVAPMEGERLSELYDETETLYRSDAKFRKDYAPVDVPIDAETIARNFMTIAFETETQRTGDRTVVEGGEIRLLRWAGDITFASYGTDAADKAYLAALAARIEPLINRRITAVSGAKDAQIRLLVVESDERQAILSSMRDFEVTPMLGFIEAWSTQPSYPCIGSIASDQQGEGAIRFGLILIKAELQHDFRRACLTEEFVQTLGLLNDSQDVRPSIFNDDQEFIELTRHDEYLLRMLYDPRLRIGMTRAEAEPIARVIAYELVSNDAITGYTR